MAQQEFVTVSQAAELADVHYETVRRAARAGRLTPYYRGSDARRMLFLRTEVEEWAKPRPVTAK